MKKHALTPEQEARRQERKEKFARLVKQVAEMSDEEKSALADKMGCVVNCEGKALSVRNTLLIALQLGANATIVGGFRQWIKQGRVVRKGEHGASILIPAGRCTDVIKILPRNPVLTLSQIPFALAGMLRRAEEREQRRNRNRAYFRQFFGLDPRTRSGRLGSGELCESNLPLRTR